jgi:site-specific recombinase XerD
MSSLNLTDALHRYLDIRAHTLRPSTIQADRDILTVWLRFLGTHHPPVTTIDQLNRSTMEDWLRDLATRRPPLKNSTRRTRIHCCRLFLQTISEWGWTQTPIEDLLRASDIPPLNRQLPKPISPDIDALLQHALEAQEDIHAKGLLLARWTGLRAGELTRLDRHCLIREPAQRYAIRVPLGKLHNERVIPVDTQTARLVELIRKQWGHRPATIDPETGEPVTLLICRPDGTHFTVASLRNRLIRLGRHLGIPDHLHPHRLRHTYATELLRFGVSFPGVMKLLGHRNPLMTLRYVEVNRDDLRQSYLRAVREARKRYPHVAEIIDRKSSADVPNALDDLDGTFTDLAAQVQAIRFNHPDPAKRKKLQRLVEVLRRAQKKLPELLA